MAFDAIVAAIGYDRIYANILVVEQSRITDLTVRVNKQKYFGQDGLYFCGFWIGLTGVMREIGLDAQKIARHIADALQPTGKVKESRSGKFLVGVGLVVGAVLGYQLIRARMRGTSSSLV
ncbi:hypothetical protein [Hymenobacter volaticus]|uniref:Uncharacterized protein n=1 Tax=Hymenobacter volaticus TaxID=2932254 RepID=A0ABY4GFY5_9BACT|nr:hypothetical protein [Hymenobacter volaticus]UOQ69607.1 hypothetical protein MUN86_29325 [Hymenobacter volaticus]